MSSLRQAFKNRQTLYTWINTLLAISVPWALLATGVTVILSTIDGEAFPPALYYSCIGTAPFAMGFAAALKWRNRLQPLLFLAVGFGLGIPLLAIFYGLALADFYFLPDYLLPGRQ